MNDSNCSNDAQIERKRFQRLGELLVRRQVLDGVGTRNDGFSRHLKEVRTEKWIPSKDEFLRFVEAAGKTSTGKFIVPWVWFRAYTGTRPSESFYMEWDDIDFDNGRIHIRPKNGNELKNKKFRVIEMHPELKPILLAWKDEWQDIHDRWWHRENVESRRKKRGLLPDHQ